MKEEIIEPNTFNSSSECGTLTIGVIEQVISQMKLASLSWNGLIKEIQCGNIENVCKKLKIKKDVKSNLYFGVPVVELKSLKENEARIVYSNGIYKKIIF